MNTLLHRSTIQLLRFHFSFFLLPVYLFALSQSPHIQWSKALGSFIILHLLVYPSSNGYNSYMDRDNSPIGGLYAPLQPTKELFYISVIMDVTAIILSFFITNYFALGILLYTIASRAYSYRGIRLKKYPVIGFLVVFICQGALIYAITYQAASMQPLNNTSISNCLIASFLIGALYPLTQIYQHREDEEDGVRTLSFILGKKGTFVCSMILFLIAGFLLMKMFASQSHMNYFFLFLLMMLPVVLFFLYWMVTVWQNESKANFRNSFLMSLVSTFCSTAFFITLIILDH